ncbi:TniB family NTP-binding protein [Neorhizobium sp. BT27B]|uniref:TniB family NTP-binding protein n=1 Tax=Neorhizobium sp. BT27B TaxID=3142625 RepID=UPI003D2AB703
MSEPSRKEQSTLLLRSVATEDTLHRARLLEEVNSIYVTTDRDQELRMDIDTMLANMMNPSTAEGYAVAVIGPPGAGKSTLVNRTLDTIPELAPRDDGYGNAVEFCLRVQTPSSCTAKTLGAAIVKATGYPLEKTPNEDDLWNLVNARLQKKMHKIIFFDEFQHVLKGPKAKGGAHLTNTIKLLMQNIDWPVWIIIAGVPDTLEFVARDEWFQMERRTRPLEIDDLADTEGDIENTRAILEALVEAAELTCEIPLTDLFIRRLMHAGLWRFGMTIQLIKMSIERALWDSASGSNLTYDHFVNGYKRMSSCSKLSNVFLSDDWQHIQREVTPKGRLTGTYKTISRDPASSTESAI